jgi:hypothetical protein
VKAAYQGWAEKGTDAERACNREERDIRHEYLGCGDEAWAKSNSLFVGLVNRARPYSARITRAWTRSGATKGSPRTDLGGKDAARREGPSANKAEEHSSTPGICGERDKGDRERSER